VRIAHNGNSSMPYPFLMDACIAPETGYDGILIVGDKLKRYLAVNYDTGNAIFYNEDVDPVSDLEAIIDRVIHVHLKDTSGGRGEWAFGALGTGHVDLAGIIRLLRARGFRGPFSLEVEGFADEDLTRAARIHRLRQSLEYLSTLGIQP
jgi:sugar phosphate isomerase/epimerase